MFQNIARVMRPGDTLKIQCGGCRHNAVWSYRQACERIGAFTAPPDIRRRLRCTGCGVRGGVTFWI